ncbi:hypothetical protein ACFOGJ_27770 [Marinibaculum pumilum]|uniref:Uncharacterized protein n=1 Tax=Marinibaculum pumilum TaxID=1766165 RepID=A0ABV7LA08_9PROT
MAILISLVNLFLFTPNLSAIMEQAQMEQPAATAPATTSADQSGTDQSATDQGGSAPTAEDMAMAEKVIGTTEIVGAAIYVLLGLLFWYFIARRGNNVFKWIWAVLAVLAILASLGNIGATFAFSTIGGILALVVLVIGIINIVLVFLPASRPWFAGGAKAGPADGTA